MSDRSVAVLAGGLSHERDVSLRSGRRLSSALRDTGLLVEEWDVDATLIGRLRRSRPDAVVVALHGGAGENGAVQSVLEMLRIPYVGADPRACRRAWDKPTAKDELARAGLRTPDWIALPHPTFRDLGPQDVLDALVDRLGLPLIFKPPQGGSALGVHVVREISELPGAMAERFVEGVEVAVTVVEDSDGRPQALPAVEIEATSGFYDYAARYTAGLATFHAPARLDDAATAAVADLAVNAHRLLGLRDVYRTDAVVTPDGIAQFLEVNVAPGLTETSLLPMAIESTGADLGTVYAALIERAVTRAYP